MKILIMALTAFQLVFGTCTSPSGDGIDREGYYISYKDTGAEEGDEVVTLILNDIYGECFARIDAVGG